MKMEFDDAEGNMSSEDVGLAARLSKKTKTQAKERGKSGDNSPSTSGISLWEAASSVMRNLDSEPKVKAALLH